MDGKVLTEEKRRKEDGMDIIMKKKRKLMEALHQIAREVTTQQDLRAVLMLEGRWIDGMVSAANCTASIHTFQIWNTGDTINMTCFL